MTDLVDTLKADFNAELAKLKDWLMSKGVAEDAESVVSNVETAGNAAIEASVAASPVAVIAPEVLTGLQMAEDAINAKLASDLAAIDAKAETDKADVTAAAHTQLASITAAKAAASPAA